MKLRLKIGNTEAICIESIQRAAYASIVTTSPTSPPDDYGIVAVVDGSKLELLFMDMLLIASRTPQVDTYAIGERSASHGTA